jgi:hypothetical protein
MWKTHAETGCVNAPEVAFALIKVKFDQYISVL